MAWNMNEVIHDPAMGGRYFDINRITYSRNEGKLVRSSTVVQARGTIYPGKMEEVVNLPEEARHLPFISFHTDTEVRLSKYGATSEDGSDEIVYDGQRWKVVALRKHSDFAQYKGYAVLILE